MHPEAWRWIDRGIMIKSNAFRTMRIITAKDHKNVLEDLRSSVYRLVANCTLENSFAWYTARKIEESPQVSVWCCSFYSQGTKATTFDVL